MAPLSKHEYYQKIANKKRDFPALILTSQDSRIVYTHYGTGPKYNEIFKKFATFKQEPLGTSLLASLSENDRLALQNWLDILHDETYVELIMPEDIVKLCPSFSLTWVDGQNYEIRFEAIKTGKVYELVLVWLEPHSQNQQQQLASKIIELLSELQTAPREVMNNLKEYLPEVNTHLNVSNDTLEDSEELFNQLLRHLHAAKGTLFFLGFNTLGETCHDVESKLEELRETWQFEQGLQPIQEAFSPLYLLLNLAEGISNKIYKTNAEADEAQLTLSQTKYQEWVAAVAQIYEQSKGLPAKSQPLVKRLEQLYHGVICFDSVALADLFKRLHNSTTQIAKELKKSVVFSVAGNPPAVYLPNRLFDSLWNALHQVLKNAIDHGVECTEIRKALGKPKVAQIVFSLEVQNGNLLLHLQDDGKGLDPQAIIESALKRQLISHPEAQRLAICGTQEEIYALLFSAGFSTQTHISSISGRGIGTNVVQEEIESYSGQIFIASAVGQWTKFTLHVPIQPNHIVIDPQKLWTEDKKLERSFVATAKN